MINRFFEKKPRLKEMCSYLFFGVLTTLVNIVVFYVLTDFTSTPYMIANVIAWFLSVLFAYVTNRKWVFQSTSKHFIREMLMFYISRLATGAMDMVLMYLFIDFISLPMLASKVIVNVVVVVSNYVLSKLIIFRKADPDEKN